MGFVIDDRGHNNSIKGSPQRTNDMIPVIIQGHHNSIFIEPGLKIGKNSELIIRGNYNHLSLGADIVLNNRTKIKITGNNNQAIIGARFSGCFSVSIETSRACLQIGEDTTISQANIDLHEPYRLIIGKDCMFSIGVKIMVSDTHSIFDLDTGERLNHGGEIIIGDHVWLGVETKVLKGVKIGQGSVIGTGAIVVKDIPGNCIAVGIPAKVVRERIFWTRDMEGKTLL